MIPNPTGQVSAKPHKFFERYLDNDLEKLTKFLEEKYKLIQQAELRGVEKLGSSEAWVESGSLSTVKWREYNVFQFSSSEIYNVFKAISDTVREACEYYGLDFEAQQYMVQGWFNINHSEVGKLNWHDHGGPFAPHFHGYYCINAEPSITHYQINDGNNRVVDNINKNNRLVVSEMGHPHAMGDWAWEGARITLAYDIEPLQSLIDNPGTIEQHWIPLL
jgi:hypothetical protein